LRMPGLFIGIASGAFQFWMLSVFTRSITSGRFSVRTVPIAVAQFLFPFIILVGCAFLLADSLLWVGVGMAVVLVACAVAWFVYSRRRR